MTEPIVGPDPRPKRRASDLVGIATVGVVAIALVGAPIYALVSGRSDRSPTATMGDIGGSPVELETLQPSLARLYRGARLHASHFEQIPCFCGCQEGRLQHRHLLDCFVLRDGRGWESHAVGCAVCQGEARLALRLLSGGTPVTEVRARIIEEFGMPEEMRDLEEG